MSAAQHHDDPCDSYALRIQPSEMLAMAMLASMMADAHADGDLNELAALAVKVRQIDAGIQSRAAAEEGGIQ
jgi:hypothetical protein